MRKSWRSPSRPESGRCSSAAERIRTTSERLIAVRAERSHHERRTGCFEPCDQRAPVAVLDNVLQSADGAVQLGVSRSGTAAYVSGEFAGRQGETGVGDALRRRRAVCRIPTVWYSRRGCRPMAARCSSQWRVRPQTSRTYDIRSG